MMGHRSNEMKTLVMSLGLLFAVSANAEFTARAKLVGQRVHWFAGSQLLICEYAGSAARFEILSSSGTCAPYIQVQ
jgi:hypothetical protein